MCIFYISSISYSILSILLSLIISSKLPLFISYSFSLLNYYNFLFFLYLIINKIEVDIINIIITTIDITIIRIVFYFFYIHIFSDLLLFVLYPFGHSILH